MAAIGTLNLQLTLSTGAFQKGIQQAQNMVQQAQQAMTFTGTITGMGNLGKAMADVGNKADKLAATKFIKNLEGIGHKAGQTLASAIGDTFSLGKGLLAGSPLDLPSKLLALPFSVAAIEAKVLAGTLETVTAGLAMITTMATGVGGVLVGAFGAAIAAPIHALSDALGEVAKAIPEVVRGMTELATPVFQLGRGAVNVAAEYQRMETVFASMTGSAAKGKAVLADLWEFAAVTPFAATDLQTGVQRLMAFGMSPDRAVNSIKVIGDLAAQSTLPLAEAVERVTNVMGKLWAQPHAHAMEMRQLTAAGIPAWKLLEEQVLRSGREIEGSIMDMVEAGKVSGMDAVFSLLEGSVSRAAGMMEEKSNIIVGLWSTIEDNVSMVARDLGMKLIDAFDIAGLERSIINGLQWIQQNMKALEPILAAIKGSFELIKDLAMVGLSALGTSIMNAGKGFTDMRDITDLWYVGTADAIDFVVSKWTSFTSAILSTIRAVTPVVMKLVNMIRDLMRGWQEMQDVVNGKKSLSDIAGMAGGLAWEGGKWVARNNPISTTFRMGQWLGELLAGKNNTGVNAAAAAPVDKATEEILAALDTAEQAIKGGGKGMNEAMQQLLEGIKPFQSDAAFVDTITAMDRLVKDIDLTGEKGLRDKEMGFIERLEGARTKFEAKGIMNEFVSSLKSAGGLQTVEEYAQAIKDLNKAFERVPAVVAEAKRGLGIPIMDLTSREAIDKLNGDLSRLKGGGVDPLEKFKKSMADLDKLRERSDKLSPQAHLNKIEDHARFEMTKMKDQDVLGLEAMAQDALDSMPELLLDPKFDAHKFKTDFIAGIVGEDIAGSIEYKDLFDMKDFTAAQVKEFEALQSALGKPGEHRNPAAALLGSKEAVSAEMKFQSQGSAGDTQQKMLDTLKQLKIVADKQLQRARDMYEAVKDNKDQDI